MDAGGGAAIGGTIRRLFPEASDLESRMLLANGSMPPEFKSPAAHIAESSVADALRGFFSWLLELKPSVLVYGDFDADGVTSTAMLFRWLRLQGITSNFFIPSRHKHGYGLHSSVIEQAAEQGYECLIVADCGTANIEEIGRARELDMNVLVIDHHTPKEELPDALLLNPHVEENFPPFCTAGLVFALLDWAAETFGCEMLGDELELAGIATIADIVPLQIDNWWLAHQALLAAPTSTNPGLQELLKYARLHGLTRLTDRQVAFNIAPRINSAGRMTSARPAVELFLATDPEEARQAAGRLENLNEQRKVEAEAVWRRALLQAQQQQDANILVLFEPDWHLGVLGLAAAKVAEYAGKAAVLLTCAPDSDDLLTGSARGGANANVLNALDSAASLLTSFGGHAAAAGLKLELSNLEALRELLAKYEERGDAETAQAEAESLPSLVLTDLSENLERDIIALSPYGPQHPAPLCILEGCTVSRFSYMGRDKTHLNLIVGDGERELRIAAFRSSHLASSLSPGMPIRPAILLEPDNWNNRIGISARLIDANLE